MCEISLYLLSCRRVIKFFAANIEVSLSQIGCIYGLVSDSLSILATESNTSWCLFGKNSVALANCKVSSPSWLPEWLAVPLLVINFLSYNASEVLLSVWFWFELCTYFRHTSDGEVGSSRLPLLGSPLFLGLINSSHLRLSSQGRLFAFQVFLFKQHHF